MPQRYLDEDENKPPVPAPAGLPRQQQDPEETLRQLAAAPSAKEQSQFAIAEQPPADDTPVDLSELDKGPAVTAPLRQKTLRAPESDLDRYARLSQEAEEAAPTEQDVLAAGIRRGMAYSRASTPAFLQQMAETAFYKPDYSQMTKVAEEEAKQPDIALSAKEQAQKRLQGLAEAARKKALLPGQLEEQRVRSAEAQAKMEQLKLSAEANKPADPADIKKFMDLYGQKYGVTIPEGASKGELKSYYDQAIKGVFGVVEAKERAKIKAEPSAAQTGREERLKNKEVNTMVTALRSQYNKEIEGTRKGLEAAEKIGQFADSKNWALLAAVGPQLAKGIGGDVGALSNKDIARYDANPQLLDRYKDMINKALTGEVSDATAQEYKDAAKVVKGLLTDKINKKQQKYRNILTKNKLYKDLGGDEDYANQQLFGGETFGEASAPAAQPAAAPAAPSPAPTGKRKVITDPSQL